MLSSNSDDDSSVGSVVPEEGVVNPDTLEDLFVDDDNYWLSEDQLYELQTEQDPANKAPPPLKDWTELDATTKSELTVGKA